MCGILIRLIRHLRSKVIECDESCSDRFEPYTSSDARRKYEPVWMVPKRKRAEADRSASKGQLSSSKV
jgi:hypothetical protein